MKISFFAIVTLITAHSIIGMENAVVLDTLNQNQKPINIDREQALAKIVKTINRGNDQKFCVLLDTFKATFRDEQYDAIDTQLISKIMTAQENANKAKRTFKILFFSGLTLMGYGLLNFILNVPVRRTTLIDKLPEECHIAYDNNSSSFWLDGAFNGFVATAFPIAAGAEIALNSSMPEYFKQMQYIKTLQTMKEALGNHRSTIHLVDLVQEN